MGHVPERSAGVLLWRRRDDVLEVLLAHMGGPLWAKKDAASWSFPKGLYDADEAPIVAAVREFTEELGVPLPVSVDELVPMGELRQPSGKWLTIWAAEADLDPSTVVPGTFSMEWPPRSGRQAEFPEIDRVEWFDLTTAEDKLVRGQRPYLERLRQMVT
jgi:predicted NUDIX family NTP pyrophosphohydrolase